MEYYFKQVDGQGNITALLTCNLHLESSETQIEITEEEYNQLLAEMQGEDLGVFDPNYNQE